MIFTAASGSCPTSYPDSPLVIFEDIAPDFDVDRMIEKILPCSARTMNLFRRLVSEGAALAKPKAAFKQCRIKCLSEDEVMLGEVLFSSALLRTNLTGCPWAFAYVATEGNEPAAWAQNLPGASRAMAWPIRYAALKLAEIKLANYIKSTFELKQISSMNPGSLALWPLEQQAPLFKLLDPLPESIGVHLNSTLWMSPDLASSGVFFETERKFYNCRLCPLKQCGHRKASFLGPAGWPARQTQQRGDNYE